MKAYFNKFVKLFLSCQFCFLFAQEDVGVVSYLDIEAAGLAIAECLGQESDPRACSPNVEVIHLEAFYNCNGNVANCDEAFAYSIPFVIDSSAEQVERDFEDAWLAFTDKTTAKVAEEINKLLPCWLPTPCPTQVDWTCVGERMGQALETAYTDYLPEYWTEVYQSVATNMPLALHWRSAMPNDGAIIAPVFTLEPKLDQYTDLPEDPRDYSYYFQGPLFPRLPVPYIPDELNRHYGGLDELEYRKESLEPATLFEYQQYGFISLFQVYGDFRLEILFDILKGPYLVTACLIPAPPFIIPLPIPVPTPVFVARAFTDWPTVPEGYPIPRVKGKPLY